MLKAYLSCRGDLRVSRSKTSDCGSSKQIRFFRPLNTRSQAGFPPGSQPTCRTCKRTRQSPSHHRYTPANPRTLRKPGRTLAQRTLAHIEQSTDCRTRRRLARDPGKAPTATDGASRRLKAHAATPQRVPSTPSTLLRLRTTEREPLANAGWPPRRPPRTLQPLAPFAQSGARSRENLMREMSHRFFGTFSDVFRN